MTSHLNSAGYTPGPVPARPEALPAFLTTELGRIAAAVKLVAVGHVETAFTPPARPRDGDVRLADGTHWDPGGGAGVYAYYGGGWNRLG